MIKNNVLKILALISISMLILQSHYISVDAGLKGIENDLSMSNMPIFQSGNSSNTVLVFDTSGSMDDPSNASSSVSKLAVAKKAGGNIMDIIAAENDIQGGASHNVGIVRFGNSAQVSVPLTNNINAPRSALQNLYTDGLTAMPDALRLSIDMLSSVPASDHPILILLSDGMPNIGLNGEMELEYATVSQQVLDLASEAGGYGICIYTIGFGNPAEDAIDEDLLRQVARNSGCGEYYNAQDSMKLSNVYVKLRHASTGGDILLEQEGSIKQDEKVDFGTRAVNDNQLVLLYTLNWPGSRLEPVVVDPAGVEVDENYPGVSISHSSSLASVVISQPIAGDWSLSALGVEVPEGVTNYYAMVSSRPDPNPPTPTPTASPTPEPAPEPSSSGFPLVIILIIVAGGAVGVYVYSNSIRKSTNRMTSNASIIGVSGPSGAVNIRLTPSFLIGRGSACNLRLSGERNVSRQHARIRFAEGSWFIQDLGSGTGTRVNGKPITAARLNSGDHIIIGNSTFLFRIH